MCSYEKEATQVRGSYKINMLPRIEYASFFTDTISEIGLENAPFTDQLIYYYQLNNEVELSRAEIKFLKDCSRVYAQAIKNYNGVNVSQPFSRPLTIAEQRVMSERSIKDREARRGNR